ncbi:MAG: bifunctional hydroxymethylpyrimidine kinase/phosphomethylpyrimidine kinase [Deltaproteobacteria bacterium]|nr:bifunctional hydroxymethylpyrimidine kinase/phosphomethylpyrimidine kinase [Deltaproteobacteria bacterium]
MKQVLTIAGSDPGGGAGIQADLKAIHANGCYALTVLAALTAQNTQEVRAVFDLPVAVVLAQLDAVQDDFTVDAAKTGMLGSAELVAALAGQLRRRPVPWLVVDPVMVSSSGHRLLAEDAVAALRTLLLPLASVATPNLSEAEVLAGHPIRDRDEAEQAARAIHALGARAVLIKGGHRVSAGGQAEDLLYDGREVTLFAAPHIVTRSTHGTGCTLSAALAARLAQGEPLPEAVQAAKDYVTGAIRHGLPLGHGRGPTDHFWRFDR